MIVPIDLGSMANWTILASCVFPNQRIVVKYLVYYLDCIYGREY
jgi:hypothetical protein